MARSDQRNGAALHPSPRYGISVALPAADDARARRDARTCGSTRGDAHREHEPGDAAPPAQRVRDHQEGRSHGVFAGKTDPQGRVEVPQGLLTSLPPGTYTIDVYFNGVTGHLRLSQDRNDQLHLGRTDRLERSPELRLPLRYGERSLHVRLEDGQGLERHLPSARPTVRGRNRASPAVRVHLAAQDQLAALDREDQVLRAAFGALQSYPSRTDGGGSFVFSVATWAGPARSIGFADSSGASSWTHASTSGSQASDRIMRCGEIRRCRRLAGADWAPRGHRQSVAPRRSARVSRAVSARAIRGSAGS